MGFLTGFGGGCDTLFGMVSQCHLSGHTPLTTFPTLEALQRGHDGLRALLFDMDGTLLRTEEIHGEVLRRMALQWRVRPPFPPAELEEHLKGMSDAQVWGLARGWENFPQELTADDFIAEKNHQLLALIPALDPAQWSSPALATLLSDARSAGISRAVVTSSERVVTDQLLSRAGLASLFDLVITLQDVSRPKPAPDPYLQAMIRLGVGPREAVVFEDSPTGLAAARASGARVLEVDWWRGFSAGG
jgi:HAD superfamily hydrolase (TIGR01509 family)